ncbi:MAG: hypothetical protein K8T25_20895 [Planctomycetia bacterium]|nr:hypothetical protein [Planctomycetia bacterium]
MQKTLDQKLADMHANPATSRAFILADAKDADMAFGVAAPGQSPETHAGEARFKSLAEYREQIREIVQQGLVDIMLMSASSNDLLTIRERIFDMSAVTPAARANDASDVFVVRGGTYTAEPSQPFRTATLDHIQCGHVDCDDAERTRGANLGLYSITLNNRLDEDRATLEAYRQFRIEAERVGFRHFLEVFNPNAPHGIEPGDVPAFINDHIARTLAGVAAAGRPVFLKVVYQGPRAMEELVHFDPHLVVGVLGGSAGTTHDAFKLLHDARKYGARAALFGRKINHSECQLAFVQFLRMLADGEIEPAEGVRAYHGVLERLKIKPRRSLAADLELTDAAVSYGETSAAPAGTSTTKSITGGGTVSDAKKKNCGCGCEGKKPGGCNDKKPTAAPPADPSSPPDFSRMTTAEKRAYQQAKRDRIFGV